MGKFIWFYDKKLRTQLNITLILLPKIKENIFLGTDISTEEFIKSFTTSLTEALEALSVSLTTLNSILQLHDDYKTIRYII